MIDTRLTNVFKKELIFLWGDHFSSFLIQIGTNRDSRYCLINWKFHTIHSRDEECAIQIIRDIFRNFSDHPDSLLGMRHILFSEMTVLKLLVYNWIMKWIIKILKPLKQDFILYNRFDRELFVDIFTFVRRQRSKIANLRCQKSRVKP